ncbi:UDP-N-acetylglucosamine 2-epimerase (non-hydrolyzing) [Cohnella endophytica]|uniref:UDP-N-acetylglucosamine 2-epimerase (Non-hydrolyzing) n=1 Tax=Cohnella endophytica TaxID=2419778 RepID=A0A494XGT7_9BACL|nr:UDP-N-acetylglucosamine 2-epimerase (non-hydrolyzing) [Cohnella endophytica]RKP47379.1 UDP-N-acetylglucosamine 2-epimerase (non-hydrolyzing) [Cohnella endophytica]
MQKLKLMTIVGTRPEIIRLSEIVKKADNFFEHIFVHTGQNYDYNLNEIFYEDLKLRKPDRFLNVVGDHLGATMGNIVAKSYELMAELKPDALLILGDTNSALSAISAKRLKIPIFHMEAGNRCFDENLPEETNRRIVDHISDVNLPYTEHARRYLLAEGVRREHIYVTGSPIGEVLHAHREGIQNSQVLKTLGLSEEHYILLSAHREENIDIEANFFRLMDAVNAMAEKYQMPIIYSVHPRSAKMIEKRQFRFHDLVRPLPPFSFTDYNHLQQHAYCVLSDSGTLPEEAAISRFAGVSIRTSTERPEALDKGCVILGGITKEEIMQAVELAVGMARQGDYGSAVPDYTELNVSATVIRLIQSYTGIVNRKVWGK